MIWFLPWICASLAAVGSGAIGAFIIVRRLAMLAGSLSHAVFAGLGFCLWLNRAHGVTWAHPILGALITGLLASALIGYTHSRYREREDALMSILWSFGMAVGLLFVFLTPGYVGDLHDFLFGSILWVSARDAWTILGLDVVVITLLFLQRHRLVAVCFDEELARIQRLPVRLFYTGLLMLIAATVVALIHIIGIILVMTMLIIPPMIASLWTRSFSQLGLWSACIGPLVTLMGCLVADWSGIPPSPAIALLASVLYFILLPFKRRSLC